MKAIFKKSSLVFASLFMLFSVSLAPASAGAVDLFPNNVLCRGEAKDSAVCKDSDSTGNPLYGKGSILATAINLLSVLAGIIAVIVLIIAGAKYVTSGDNSQEVEKVRSMVIYALVGLVIAAAAQLVVRAVLSRF